MSGKEAMGDFVIFCGKLDQNGFIPSSTSRPPRKVNCVTFVVRIDCDEPSSMCTIQLAEELERPDLLGRPWRIQGRAWELNTGHLRGRIHKVGI